jgi:hypothetical protein
MMIMLVSFIMTCRANAQKKGTEDEDEVPVPKTIKRDD